MAKAKAHASSTAPDSNTSKRKSPRRKQQDQPAASAGQLTKAAVSPDNARGRVGRSAPVVTPKSKIPDADTDIHHPSGKQGSATKQSSPAAAVPKSRTTPSRSRRLAAAVSVRSTAAAADAPAGAAGPCGSPAGGVKKTFQRRRSSAAIGPAAPGQDVTPSGPSGKRRATAATAPAALAGKKRSRLQDSGGISAAGEQAGGNEKAPVTSPGRMTPKAGRAQHSAGTQSPAGRSSARKTGSAKRGRVAASTNLDVHASPEEMRYWKEVDAEQLVTEMVGGLAPPPAEEEERQQVAAQQQVIFVLESAQLEVAQVGKVYQLLNCDDHGTYLRKHGKDPNLYRPDITHQALLTILDSPLNKAGKIKGIYIHTTKNVLIQVNTKVRIPRTFPRFKGLMVQLLQKLSIRATNGPDKLLKVIKGPVTKYFPVNARRIGFSVQATLHPIEQYVRTSLEDTVPVVFVVGAFAHGAIDTSYVDEEIAVSQYSLSAAYALSRITNAMEQKWGIV